MNEKNSTSAVLKESLPGDLILALEILSNALLVIYVKSNVDALSFTFGGREIKGVMAQNIKLLNAKHSGNVFLFSIIGLPVSCTLHVQALVKPNLLASGLIDIVRSAFMQVKSTIAPLMITSVGRSGSTLLMQCLAAHRQVVVRSEYPMEASVARKGFSELLNVMPDIYESNAAIARNRAELGTGISRDFKRKISSVAHEISDGYLSVFNNGSNSDIAPVYYAEKNMSPESLIWELVAGTRELILVRDPRDMICSTLAFNKKRGSVKFGRQDVVSDLEYVFHRASMSRPWVIEPWLTRRNLVKLVKYEDLVLAQRETLAEIFNYLGLSASNEEMDKIKAVVNSSTEIVSRHVTAESVEYSVGRWRKEMSAEMINACNEAFADYIELFGYDKC